MHRIWAVNCKATCSECVKMKWNLRKVVTRISKDGKVCMRTFNIFPYLLFRYASVLGRKARSCLATRCALRRPPRAANVWDGTKRYIKIKTLQGQTYDKLTMVAFWSEKTMFIFFRYLLSSYKFVGFRQNIKIYISSAKKWWLPFVLLVRHFCLLSWAEGDQVR